ncbi:hypothetical protein, partial [Chelatococcus sp.]|uniref:hypothetical protein n=1 Tax=Chelatococcus sp. TaxID=1953771 RepID=UPI0034370EE2
SSNQEFPLRIRRFIELAGLSLVMTVSIPAGIASAQDLKSLQGAWLAKSSDCTDVYTMSAKGISFKKPVDLFAPAFIVSGNRLTTPGASCRIKSVRPSGNLLELALDCVNAVGSNDVRVLMARQPDGSLNRYLNAQDTIGSPHQDCARRPQ